MKFLASFFLAALLLSASTKADQILQVSKAEADKISDHLRQQKYIILYCGCCDNDSATILRIDEVLKVPAKEKGYYNIKIGGDLIMSFKYDKLTLGFTNPNILKGKFYDAVDLASVHAYWGNAENVQNQLTATNLGRVAGINPNACLDYFRFPKYSEMPEEEKKGDYIGWVNDMLQK